MKRISDLLKAVCSIGAAIMIYLTVIHVKENGAYVLIYVIASVFALALTASLFFISSLTD